MKNILLTLSSAVILLAACKTEKKSDALDIDKNIVFTDTSALKQGNYSTDVATQGTAAPVDLPQEKAPPVKPEVRTVTKIVRVVERREAPPVQTATPPVATPVPAPVSEAPVPVADAPAPGSTGTGTDVAAVEEKKKKEGWSDAAKGATIGGVGGAVAGAVIGKGKGAVIGGVLGAAGGYILGRNKDKKSGRADSTKQ